jgi:hypothetical protein
MFAGEACEMSDATAIAVTLPKRRLALYLKRNAEYRSNIPDCKCDEDYDRAGHNHVLA